MPDLFPYIIFTIIIFANILLNTSKESLENSVPEREPQIFTLIKNRDTLYVGDSIEDLFYKLLLTQNGIQFYSKYPNKMIFEHIIPHFYKMTLLGDSIYFFNNQDFVEKKGPIESKVTESKDTEGTEGTETKTFLTISDGIIKVSDANGNTLYTLPCDN